MEHWWLSSQLWNNLAHVRRLTDVEKKERISRAVISKTWSRGCVVIVVDFKGDHSWQSIIAPVAGH